MSNYRILVGLGTCGIAAGAQEIYNEIEAFLKAQSITDMPLESTGCIGMCYNEPIISIFDQDNHEYLYGGLNKKKMNKILQEHLMKDQPVQEYLIRSHDHDSEEKEYYANQTRIVLENCGMINPESIEEYIDKGGYEGLTSVLKNQSPDDVIDSIKKSGLRGRGGGGFPTGIKWELTKKEESEKKYIICNGDEGDPGAFMDRSIMEGDPHKVIEGMAICAYAVGADEGYIYVRAEYPLAVKRLKLAIRQATENNYLGQNIQGTGFNLTLHIKEGAGAFVCGEETALIASIEGKRGMPRFRPPFPSVSGLWGYPTNNNNVETYANIPWIFRNSPEKYAALGTEKSAGSKVFALAGKIKRGGLIEVSMGIPLKDIIYKIGGGIKDDKAFKAVQMGGPSGGCIPASMVDISVDYDSLKASGAIMGSGGMVVMDESTCMIDVAKFFLRFTQDESCGKCTFCRIGTKRMLEILERISEGKGEESDIEKLEDLAFNIKMSSLCGLGQTAPNPVLTTLKYFRDEYDAHIKDKKCPAGVCKALIEYKVDAEACIGCGLCAKACPVNAISGEKKSAHVIDPAICTKCGACRAKCPVNAIVVI